MISNWKNFDFIIKNKNKLVVTIGESWTWGDSLGKTQHNVIDDKEFRLANVYGAQFANLIDADFLNIAEPGQSNLWITDHFKLFMNNIDDFNYTEIIVVLTLTEVGREYQGDRDTNRDYVKDLKTVTNINSFLDKLSNYISDNINETNNTRIKLLVGTNFVDSNYDFPILSKSWVDVIAEKLGILIERPCFVVGSWVLDRFDDLLTVTPAYTRENFLIDLIRCTEIATSRTKFLMKSKYNYKKASKHPTPEGHKFWAEYLLEMYDKQK